MTEEDYEGIKDCLCPYCAAHLPDRMVTTNNEPLWEHVIPETEHIFPCMAAKFRNRWAGKAVS